jgi:hypothetical protein
MLRKPQNIHTHKLLHGASCKATHGRYPSARWGLGQHNTSNQHIFHHKPTKTFWLGLTHKPLFFADEIMPTCTIKRSNYWIENLTSARHSHNYTASHFCIPHQVRGAWDPGSTRVTAGWRIQTNMKHLTDSQPVQTSSSRHNARKETRCDNITGSGSARTAPFLHPVIELPFLS